MSTNVYVLEITEQELVFLSALLSNMQPEKEKELISPPVWAVDENHYIYWDNITALNDYNEFTCEDICHKLYELTTPLRLKYQQGE